MEIKDRLRQLRTEILQISQDEFSSRINIQRTTLSHMETGRIGITMRNIEDICRVFHISADWLIHGEKPIFADIKKDDLLEEIAAIYAKLEEKYRLELMGYIRRLSEEQQLARLAQHHNGGAYYKDEEGNAVLKDEKGNLVFKDSGGQVKLLVQNREYGQRQPVEAPPKQERPKQPDRAPQGRRKKAQGQ